MKRVMDAMPTACVKTYKLSNSLRWRQPSDNELVALVEATHGNPAPILQQAWQCIETGEVDWRDVPLHQKDLWKLK